MLKDDKYSKFVQATFEVAADFQRGSVIPWTLVEQAMNRGRNEEGGRQIVRRVVRKILRDRDIVIRVVSNVGLRFLTDQEASVEVPRSRQQRAYRQLGRGIRENKAIRDGMLTVSQRLVFVRQSCAMVEERREIGRSCRELNKGRKKTETHPIRKAK
jgi:hypothetical protein